MARTLKSDRLLFILTLLLVALGVVMVYSASAATAESPYTFLVRQALWALVGFAAMFAVMRVDYRTYKHPAVISGMAIVTITLLVAVFFIMIIGSLSSTADSDLAAMSSIAMSDM